ncbi:hypothetical protein AALO_G00006110 [Alosa alosa]|uniref:NAD(P)-binding domain-containing protein n=1 Tax=Alosa alosa TaxID=278164 RepID=A0AAV6HF24_9TELE|nr:hypothetical protein AALO_G00006110 [Alosa alosa]
MKSKTQYRPFLYENKRIIELKMKLVVLGGTGQTGQHLVNQALQQGHTVTAVVRNPGKMTVSHENLKVVEGNIFSGTA